MADVPQDKIFAGNSTKPEYLTLRLANRHGLVTGATGTGKTVTLQVLAEGFSRLGVPVFAADVKGDLSGVAAMGDGKDFILQRAKDVGITYQPEQFPVVFWDLYGEQGHPIRTTVMEMGPLLISRMLALNDTQEGVINIAFKFADDDPQLADAESDGLVDLKDLRELLNFLSKNAKAIGQKYGNVASATVGAVQRQLLVLENQGGTKFFGEPALAVTDLMKTAPDGRGIINILTADKLMESPQLYSTFLLWLLSELFEKLPEVGDLDKPKLVFFFDEAHLLFDEAPKVLLDKIEQVVRLIRSKGVGVYFVTQNPLDVPDKVLAQLGNRVQHALRAFTPRDQKAVKAAAETFRPNPKLKTEQVITELGKGEALVSFLEGNGTPSMVQRALIAPPAARIGPVTGAERKAVMAKSPIKGKYDQVYDPESAYEILQKRVGLQPESSGAPTSRPGPWGQAQREEAPPSRPPSQPQPQSRGGSVPRMPRSPLPPEAPEPAPPPSGGGWGDVIGDVLGGGREQTGPRGGRPRGRMSTGEVATRQVVRSVASQVGGAIGRALVRGVLGGLTGKK
jgi:DNA double-strand break repair helicase HerA and related ATPase